MSSQKTSPKLVGPSALQQLYKEAVAGSAQKIQDETDAVIPTVNQILRCAAKARLKFATINASALGDLKFPAEVVAELFKRLVELHDVVQVDSHTLRVKIIDS